MDILVSLTIVQSCEGFAALRTTVRSFALVAQLMILSVEAASEGLSTYAARMVGLSTFRGCSIEGLCKIAQLRMKRSHVPTKSQYAHLLEYRRV